MSSGKNYFSLFGLTEIFDIDLGALTERYRELQKKVHPDKFASGAEQEKNYSVQQAALINDAYNVLKNPLLRAKYMLELNGVALDDDKNQVMEPAFLMQQMELRESLDAARNSVDDLEDLIDKFQQNYENCVQNIKLGFDNSAPDHSSIADNVRKIQFYVRLMEEAESFILTLENQ